MEAKAAQSSIEEEAVQRVRKHFGKSEGEKRIVTEGEMRMGDMPEKKEVQKEIQKETRPETAKTADAAASQAPVKKKKNIIFVSNPHNSKMQSQKGHQSGAGSRPAAGGKDSAEKEMPAERRAQAVRELLRPEAGTRAVRVRARAVPQGES